MMHATQPALRRRFLWSATLALGFGTAWGVVVLWLAFLVIEGSKKSPIRQDLVFRKDGKVFVCTRSGSTWQTTTYTDLEGRPVNIAEEARRPIGFAFDLNGLPEAPEDEPQWITPTYLPKVSPSPDVFAKFFWELNWPARMRTFYGGRQETWRFMHDGQLDGRGYLVGFDIETKARVGYIGRRGFSSEPIIPSDLIPVRGEVMADESSRWDSSVRYSTVTKGLIPHWHVFIPSGNDLLFVDLLERKVRRLFTAPAPIEGVTLESDWQASGRGQRVLARTADTLYVLDQTHKLQTSFRLPVDARGQLAYVQVGKHTSVIINSNYDPRESTISWIGPSGVVQKTRTITLGPDSNDIDKRTTAVALAFAVPVPSLSALAILLSPFEDNLGGDESYPEGLKRNILDTWPGVVLELVTGLLCAAWGRRQMVRYAVPRRERMVWILFVFLSGLPGLAGYLLHRRWPVRAECPACHTASPRDRDACAACGIPFASAPARGIEVFA